MTTPAEHAKAWKAAYILLEKQQDRPDMESEVLNEIMFLKSLCAAVYGGYDFVAKEQENQNG